MPRLSIRKRSNKIRERIRWTKLYSFIHSPDSAAQNLQGPGYSRFVHCNNPSIHDRPPLYYPANYISTTKYNFVTFLPKALFEQFRRIANLYFLLCAVLSFTEVSPSRWEAMVLPLVFVVGLSMGKEALEDWRRFLQDMNVNNRNVSVHSGDGRFCEKNWKSIRVGDVVKVEKDEFFPADLLLLSSSYDDGICYVETMNLDGETNLKVKRSLESTLILDNDGAFKDFTAMIKCESPNPNLYTFVGNFEYEQQVYSLDPNQILLRDSKLRNTEYIYGVVIFTGHESKVMQNSTESPSKRSTIEKKMDKIIYILLALLFLISTISAICYAVDTSTRAKMLWYLQPESVNQTFDPSNAFKTGFLHFITALMLYGYLLPISLYVSIEVVKLIQARFINQDLQMYDEETGKPARARTSNINEELGQVDTILTDKTGTLTCNQMDFLKCTVAGLSYGVRASEVELAAAKQMASESEDSWEDEPVDIELDDGCSVETANGRKAPIKGFSFEDDRLMQGNWMNEPNPDDILLFFRILAICQTAIPEQDEVTGAFTYEAESPDEGAFLVAAGQFGFEFSKRTQSSVFVRERYPSASEQTEREYKILNLLEFNSKRKRMTVIVRDENGQILLLCKGADTIIFERLSRNGKKYLEDTTKHLNEYGDGGLRTLALSYRVLDESEYTSWNAKFVKAKTTIGPDREIQLEQIADTIERELILVGATAVEDKLQKGVPQCIDKLAHAGLKIWVLTGDKMETAINIGFACSLLRQGMKQICISTTDTDLLSMDANKGIVLNLESEQAVKENIMLQITNASQMIKLEKDPFAAFALIIDGKSLTYALEDDMKQHFLDLAVDCASVICCRVSPRQKALVTRLVKDGTGKTTLAIGDGANDVGMIQEADIGVGISGVEGMQAVMASDFSISQFRYLERLLIVHGHWCYKRIAQMICYFVYKNIALGLTLFYFEAYAGFTGQSTYDDTFMVMFNVILTSLPVMSLGILEQDVSSEICLQFPTLYQQGPKNLFFDWYRIIGWIGNGIYASLTTFFVIVCLFPVDASFPNGMATDMASMGTTMFTGVIWAVNIQIALNMSHFTWIQHACVWGSIISWYSIMIVHGWISEGDFETIFIEVLAPSPIFWLATLLVIVFCNLPYFFHICFERMTSPMDHHVLQEIKYYKHDIMDQNMWKREKSKARQKTKIGFTARVDAKIRHVKGKLHHRRVSSMKDQ